VRSFAAEEKEVTRFEKALQSILNVGYAKAGAQGLSLGLVTAWCVDSLLELVTIFAAWNAVLTSALLPTPIVWLAPTSIWAAAALAFFYGAFQVEDGKITLGEVISVFGMMLFAVIGISQALNQLPEVAPSSVLLSRARLLAWSLIREIYNHGTGVQDEGVVCHDRGDRGADARDSEQGRQEARPDQRPGRPQ
jgi:hypothetical protein